MPNWLTLGITLTGLALATARLSGLSLGAAFAGFLVGLAVMLPGHLIGATGAGDVKLFAAIGTLIGPGAIVMAFFYTALAGGALAIVIAVRRRLLYDTFDRAATLLRTGGANIGEIERVTVNRFAYAPAIAIGSLAAALGL